MKRDLKATEHEAVTEGNLTDAQEFVKALAVDIREQRSRSEGDQSAAEA
jgi:hypothetical protein